MHTAFIIFHSLISVMLVLAILVQERGSGLSATFGGSGGFHVSKRGAEKVLFNATIVLALLFVLNSLLFIFI